MGLSVCARLPRLRLEIVTGYCRAHLFHLQRASPVLSTGGSLRPYSGALARSSSYSGARLSSPLQWALLSSPYSGLSPVLLTAGPSSCPLLTAGPPRLSLLTAGFPACPLLTAELLPVLSLQGALACPHLTAGLPPVLPTAGFSPVLSLQWARLSSPYSGALACPLP